jgi:ribosomal protein S6--L-glutamate ligase
MKIAIVSARSESSGGGSVMREAIDLLEEKGAAVDVVSPEEGPINLGSLRPEHDLYILKSGTETALSLIGSLHAAGAATLNPYPIVVEMKNKVIATKVLHAAGVPLPDTFVAAEATQLTPILGEGPLVVKPHWGGSKGRGVQIVKDADELKNIPSSAGMIFAQRFHEPDGRDLKIYCIGGKVFGVLRVWPARTYEDKLGEPFEVSQEMREIAARCGRAFGVDLFGLDIIVSKGEPYVVDINTFPGFKGVPDAGRLLADYIHSAAERAMRGEPLISSER